MDTCPWVDFASEAPIALSGEKSGALHCVCHTPVEAFVTVAAFVPVRPEKFTSPSSVPLLTTVTPPFTALMAWSA